MTGRHRAPTRRQTAAVRQERAEQALALHGGNVDAAAIELGEPREFVAEVSARLDRIGSQP
jgi:hypothetical protein